MAPQITAALVSGTVSIAIALIALAQGRRERRKWLVDTKVAWLGEIHKLRLNTYPEAFRIIARLSTRSREEFTSAMAAETAEQLNAWFYSAGGMCATASTRGAVLGLRSVCDSWARSGQRPDDFYDFRNLAMRSLRLDLDLSGLETYDFNNRSSVLAELRRELEEIEKNSRNVRFRKSNATTAVSVPGQQVLTHSDQFAQQGDTAFRRASRQRNRISPDER